MLGMRRKRGLRNWVIIILRRQPRNGAEIMDDMEVMTHGWWRPSPGSVYPLLEEMVREGSLKKQDDGRYALANARIPDWSWPGMGAPHTVEDVVRELSGLTAYLEDLKRTQPKVTEPIGSELDAVVERLRKLRN